jgi:signal transduction histidine kinase
MSDQTLGPPTTQVYEYLLRTTSDGVLIADKEQRITHVNPAAAGMLSITVEDSIGKTPAQCFPHNIALQNLFEREGDQKLDIRLPRRRLAIGLAATLEGGERVILLQDVTEKRDLETRREQLIKAIAHDLRNPISAITGFVDLVSKFGELNAQQEKFLTRVRQTTSKLYDLAESLVDLAWIEAGMPLKHEPIRLDDALERAVTATEPLARKQKITIAVSVQKPLPVVMGDPDRLHLVIFHLLQNAVMYSLPERSIAIHAWGDEHEVYCSVADRGFGIADDELELIFDRMYRSRDERVRELPGGGIGLTLARTIITRHGGDIWASSNLGAGSTFTFVLPTVHL